MGTVWSQGRTAWSPLGVPTPRPGRQPDERVLLLGRAGLPAGGLLVDVRVGGRVLDKLVAEGDDVVADEFQDSLAGRDALLEEIDNPAEQSPVGQVDRTYLEEVPLNLLVDDLVVRRERLDPGHVRPPLLLALDDVLDAHVSLLAGPISSRRSCSAARATGRDSSETLRRRPAPRRSPRCRRQAPGECPARPPLFLRAAQGRRRGSA